MEKLEEILSQINTQDKRDSKNALMKYIKKWPLFVLLGLFGIATGYFYALKSPNVYQVKSRILVTTEKSSMADILDKNSSQTPVPKADIENQIGILKSYTMFRKALDRLNWETTWYHKDLIFKKELYENEPFKLIVPPNAENVQNVPLKIVMVNSNEYSIKVKGEANLHGNTYNLDIEETRKFGEPFLNDYFNFTLEKGTGVQGESYLLNFNNLNTLTNKFMKITQISKENINTDVISIIIEGETPGKNVKFINELNQVFIEFGIENKNKNSENSLKFVNDQLSRIQNSLEKSEKNYSNYRQYNQVIDLGQEAQMTYNRLEEIENEQYITQLQYDYYQNLYNYLDDSEKIEDMINPSIIEITDSNLNGILSRLTELYNRREILAHSVQEKNPRMVLLEKEIQVTRDALEETLKNQLKSTESKLTSIQGQLNSMQARLGKLPETEKKLIELQRDFELNNELYVFMSQKKAEVSIARASVVPEVQVIDPAMVEAAVRVGPDKMKNVAAGLAGGLILPFMLIALAGFFNNKIETREEIEKEIEIPVLEGIIRHKYKLKLPVIHHPRSGIAESFRGIKSNLNAILEQPGSKVVSINSMIPGEGKSFISSNFAAILTKTDKKVLLIAADMHKPTLYKYFNLKNPYGLSDYLRNEKSIDEITEQTSIPNLSFIRAGSSSFSSTDLLDSNKLGNLIDWARTMFNFVIIDNPPLLLVPDAILTSRYADISLFILRINHSHKEEIRQINRIVDFNKLERAALVVNGAPDRGYGYGKKYWKKGYGEYKHKMKIA
ncbi:MAG: polysaccharide biosynthesis tyrosine autokinase [Prolixibacteraceae bacterium]|nr:polysaccharide biosynthesis tyrosine autokinase [Prolixibacteraceae bacterium]